MLTFFIRSSSVNALSWSGLQCIQFLSREHWAQSLGGIMCKWMNNGTMIFNFSNFWKLIGILLYQLSCTIGNLPWQAPSKSNGPDRTGWRNADILARKFLIWQPQHWWVLMTMFQGYKLHFCHQSYFLGFQVPSSLLLRCKKCVSSWTLAQSKT